jgi:acetyltransferase-like isoleucine patch superfamily enzyme
MTFSMLTMLELFIFKIGGNSLRLKMARRWGCKIGINCILSTNLGSEPYLIEIGDNCSITSNVDLITHDGGNWVLKNSRNFNGTKYGKIVIGNNVYIGTNSVILPNVCIGSNCVIGAGSVLTHNVPSNTVFAGNPAKFICSIDEYYEKCCKNVGNLENSNYWEDYIHRKKSKKEILMKYFQNK